jgi:putative oxidoreductase
MTFVSKWAPHAARVLFGLIFLVFGLNFFFGFLPQPPPPPEPALGFMTGLLASGYVFPLIKGIEIAAGIALLANRFVPLALVLLAPIVVNIVGFHLLAPPAGMAIAILLLELYLAWVHRGAFAPLFRARLTGETSEPKRAFNRPAHAA